MFKLVVLSALLAIVAAKPATVSVSSSSVSIPNAVSHQSRTDVINDAFFAVAAPFHTVAVAPATVAIEPVLAPATVAVQPAPAAVAVQPAVVEAKKVEIKAAPAFEFRTTVPAHLPLTYAAVAPLAYPTAVSSQYRYDFVGNRPATAHGIHSLTYAAPYVYTL